MDFFDVVRQRRSIRNFKTDPLPDGALEKIVDTARFAMSGANGQPWEFVAVRDEETKSKIVDIYCEIGREPTFTFEQTRELKYRHNMFKNPYPQLPAWKKAPVIIAVCGDLRTYQATVVAANLLGGEGGPQGTYLKNMGNATQLLCLAATALGLGAQWVSVSLAWGWKVKELLGVPDDLIIHTLVPIGYPAHKPATPYRREVKDILHYDRYDRSKYRTAKDIVDFLALLRQNTKQSYDKVVVE